MSDIQSHYTQIAKTTGAGAGGPTALTGNGPFGGLTPGLAFWDLIIATLGQKPGEGDIKNVKTNADTTNEKAALTTTISAQAVQATEDDAALIELEGEADLIATLDDSLLALLGETKEEDEDKAAPLSLFDILQIMQNPQAATDKDKAVGLTPEKLQKRIDLYQKIIDRLTAGLPVEARGPVRLETLVDRLQNTNDLLQTGKIHGEDAPLTLFIALGLSPAQLTQLSGKIAKVEDKLGRELTVDDIIAGVGGLISVQSPDEITTSRIGAQQHGIPAQVGTAQPDDGRTGENKQVATPSVAATPAERFAPLIPAANDDTILTEGDRPSYQPAQKSSAETANNSAIPVQSVAASPGTAIAIAPTTLSHQNTGGNIVLPADWLPFVIEVGGSNYDIQTGLPLTQASAAAHAATSIAQAGQSHPATQMIAATLTRMVHNGGPREMIIQMDPPELGRVVATLQFGKDKTIKAIMTVEKPETYHLLLRDAATLERALQDAGLTTDSASLSFELAQDGSAFNSDNNGEGGGEPSSNGTGDENESGAGDILQSTMTWQVDPDTGYVRYSMLA